LRDRIVSQLRAEDAKIETVELYGIHVDAERRFSFGVQKHRQHAFIRFVAGDHSGWAEANLGYNKEHPRIPFAKRIWRMKWYTGLKGMTVGEALTHLGEQRDKLGYREMEYAEMALLDLAGRLLDRPAVDLLELDGRKAIPGVYCILNDDPAHVKREATRAIGQNLRTHLKVKLYGEIDTDLGVVRAAREAYGRKAYIVGDVNMGYRRERSDEPINGIARALASLRDAGLSACEDPAEMSIVQWADLQKRVGKLDLVPDVPLRPAWKAPRQIDPTMGRVFNMHPACMGSVLETVSLGRLIRSWDRRLMVGDSSLVGPACPAWQQVAIGLGADWVEAIEKPQENNVFDQCLLRKPTGRTKDGRFAITRKLPGFGVEMDPAKLRKLAYDTASL